MNPLPEEPKPTPTGDIKPALDPATYVPKDSSPQADLAALEAISALEAEEGTSRPVLHAQTIQPTQPVQFAQPTQEALPAVDVMTPFVPEQPSIVAEDVLSGNLSQPAAIAPQTNSDPFPVAKKSSKMLILVLIAIVVLIGGAIAGYFVWQSMQLGDSNQTSESTNSTQPDGPTIPAPTDTESSVNESATSLEQGANTIDERAYDDKALSDATLYEN
jgi:hypothetical protein